LARDPVNEIACECIAVRVRLLARLVTGVCDAGLRRHGLRVAQVNILVAAGHSGPIAPTELAAFLVMDKSTLSRDVASLLRRGLLRKVEGDDRRSHQLELTAAGREKVAAILPAWRATQAALREQLGTENLAGLFGAVERVWAKG
jgi:DNA-binding MarR family transcriptional regulator